MKSAKFFFLESVIILSNIFFNSNASVKDISPRAQVHLLVIPNKHIEELVNMDKGDQVIIGEMFASAQRLATDTGISDSGYRLIINQGEHSGQMVDHLHLHVIGGEQLGGMV